MPRTPRHALGYALVDDTMRLHVPHRHMPIVVVPGLMGSRLSDPKSGKLAWNPKGIPFGAGPRAFKVDYGRLSQSNPLVADEKNGFKDRARRNEVKHIRHYNNIIGEFYGDLAKALAEMHGGSFEEFGVKPRVYCCGYDWRQDNARSALRLAEVVEEALADTREDRVIIVAHSMGGLVARYYCHALGGESRVHALVLIGSPTLGAPTAYVQLKAGMHGSYPREIGEAIDSGDPAKIVPQVGHVFTNLVRGLSAVNTRGDVMELFDVVYIALCLGAGRWLSRDETRYFARQLASMYQLMPNKAYCHTNNHWVLFDPLATGHPPTGTMLVFPTLLDAVTDGVAAALSGIDEGAAKAGEDLKHAVEKLKPGEALRTSARAHRNKVTLEELAEEIAEAVHKVEKKDEPFHLHKIYKLIRELYDRADECILHTGPHEHFYRDIYTGLLDVVEQRALCAGNVELALRFDETLTTGDGGHASGHGLMKAMLRPLLGALGLTDRGGGGHGGGHGHGGSDGPKVYMHPHTINIYSESETVEAGAAILPLEILSNDDSNEVHYEMLPLPVGMFGDGTVPNSSANPPASQLSHDFVVRESFPGVAHAALTSDSNVIDFVKRRLDAMVEDFVHGRRPHVESRSEHGEGDAHDESEGPHGGQGEGSHQEQHQGQHQEQHQEQHQGQHQGQHQEQHQGPGSPPYEGGDGGYTDPSGGTGYEPSPNQSGGGGTPSREGPGGYTDPSGASGYEPPPNQSQPRPEQGGSGYTSPDGMTGFEPEES